MYPPWLEAESHSLLTPLLWAPAPCSGQSGPFEFFSLLLSYFPAFLVLCDKVPDTGQFIWWVLDTSYSLKVLEPR